MMHEYAKNVGMFLVEMEINRYICNQSNIIENHLTTRKLWKFKI